MINRRALRAFRQRRHGLLRQLIDLRGHALQLPLYAAVLAEARRAMDDWIDPARWPEYQRLLQRYGLVALPDCLFLPLETIDPARETAGRTIAGLACAPTTRARGARFVPGAPAPPDGASVHVLVSRRPDWAQQARAAAWYPLAIGDRVIPKPRIDHPRLGQAFGYPECCVDFFRRHNDWQRQNIFAEAARRSATHTWLANSLTKSSPWMLTYHLPCAFDCPATVEHGRAVWQAVLDLDPTYAREIRAFLRRPVFALSERAVFQLTGLRETEPARRLQYRQCHDLRGGVSVQNARERTYSELLARGDELIFEPGLVEVHQGGRPVGYIEPCGNDDVVEVPVVLRFDASTDPATSATG